VKDRIGEREIEWGRGWGGKGGEEREGWEGGKAVEKVRAKGSMGNHGGEDEERYGGG